jgi:hypothetical protein
MANIGMNRSAATILFSFAAMLLVLGLASAFYSHDHVLGWNPKGRSGLIICGVSAGLAVIFGFLSDKGQQWAVYAGLALSFLIIAMPGSRFFIAGRAYSAGDSTKWLSMVILGCTALVGLRTFISLSLLVRRGKQP